jgi:hypothetical protein
LEHVGFFDQTKQAFVPHFASSQVDQIAQVFVSERPRQPSELLDDVVILV